MRLYVPPQYVPDKYDTSDSGRSGLVKLSAPTQTLIFGAKPPTSAGAPNKPAGASSSSAVKVRWSSKVHPEKLLLICYRDHKGKLPKKFDLRNAIATEIGLEYTQMVSNAKKMTGLEIE